MQYRMDHHCSHTTRYELPTCAYARDAADSRADSQASLINAAKVFVPDTPGRAFHGTHYPEVDI